jgi:hypothetical protein
MMNPTNARAVEKFLESALMDQSTRIGGLDEEEFTREVSSFLTRPLRFLPVVHVIDNIHIIDDHANPIDV